MANCGDNMKKVFKGLLCLLLAIILPFTSSPVFAQGAAATAPTAISSDKICGSNIQLFSDNAGGYLLASTDKGKYRIARLPAGGGSPSIVADVTNLGTAKAIFTQSNGVLYALYSVNTYNSATHTYTYQTTVTAYTPTGQPNIIISALQIPDDKSVAVDKEGKLFALSADRSKILVYSSTGAALGSIPSSRGQYAAICCSPDGSTLFVKYTNLNIMGMGVFSSADYAKYSSAEIPLLGTTSVAFPLRFLTDSTCIDTNGQFLAKDQSGSFVPVRQVYSSSLPVSACLTSDGRLLYNRGNGIIFAADPQNSSLLGQYSYTGNLVDMASSGDSACALLNIGSGYAALQLTSTSLSPVQYTQIQAPTALSGKDALKSVWKQMNPAPGTDISAFIDILSKNGGNSSSAYTIWPAVGDFPLEMLPPDNKWSVTLNSAFLSAGDFGAPWIEIERQNGGKYTRTLQSGLTLSEDGRTITFDAPSSCQEGDAFTIRVYNLRTAAGEPAALSYNVNLFSLIGSEPDKPGQLSSDTYKIDRTAREVTGIPIGTTIAQARQALGSPDKEIRTLRADGSVVTSGNTGTGMRMQLIQNGAVADELTLVVFGDLTGEGNVNSLDINRLMNYLLDQGTLSGPALEAADLNHDGFVDTLDLVRMKKYTFGTSDIVQTK